MDLQSRLSGLLWILIFLQIGNLILELLELQLDCVIDLTHDLFDIACGGLDSDVDLTLGVLSCSKSCFEIVLGPLEIFDRVIDRLGGSSHLAIDTSVGRQDLIN